MNRREREREREREGKKESNRMREGGELKCVYERDKVCV
jgi:hypothetical protein